MGWWKPYFFTDLEGVQLLVPSFVLEGTFGVSWCSAAVVILALATLDRGLASLHQTHQPQRHSDNVAAAFFMAQRLSAGLVMLLLMSFNAIVFAYTIAALGAAERYFLWRRRQEQSCSVPPI